MPGVTRVGVRTAAGGLEETYAAVMAGTPCYTAAPYPADGLRNALTAAVPGLDRTRAADALLVDLLRQTLVGLELSRTGLVVATSSGNIGGPFERWHREHHTDEEPLPPALGRAGPTLAAVEALDFGGPVTTLSVACVSGTAAFTIAEGWLADGLCDRVVVAGVDALSLFVHAGFSTLGALASHYPQPLTEHHDGLLLGEAAAVVVLEREGLLWVGGTGLASDAKHGTAPDPEAAGAIRAALTALLRSQATPDRIHTVSPHGTGTVLNDAMESVAMRTLFPDGPKRLHVVKRAIGHTLGAAGTVEAALALLELRSNPGDVLSLSSAFGGMNASIVLSSRPPRPLEPRPVHGGPERTHTRTLREVLPDAPATVFRHDRYVRRGVAAFAEQHLDRPLPANTALVIGSRSNCILTDRRHHARIIEAGAGNASPRAFVDTLPAAPACLASRLFGWVGPILAFIDEGSRAAEEAERLVRYGHADAAVALQLEVPTEYGPVLAISQRFDA